MAKWWREPADLETVDATYGPMIDGSDPTDGFIVMSQGEPIGFMQRYRLDDNPEWQRAVAGVSARYGPRASTISSGSRLRRAEGSGRR